MIRQATYSSVVNAFFKKALNRLSSFGHSLIIIACVICCLAVSLKVTSVSAAQDRDTNPADGLNVSVDLHHEVEIPQILFFRIGSIGAVDQVSFNLSQTQTLQPNNSTYNGAALQLGDSSVIDATSNGQLDVYLVANVAPVDISYTVSDPNGLSDGAGNYIPFDQIITESSDAGLPAPILDNAGGPVGSGNAVTILGNYFGGRVTDYLATWTYRYRNDQVPVAGVYAGRITYTASVP